MSVLGFRPNQRSGSVKMASSLGHGSCLLVFSIVYM